MFLRSYCLIGLGDTEELKEDLSYISETSVNYLSGTEMIISTFKTTFKIGEIENFLQTHERTFIMFEMTPGFFSAVLNNDKFQQALFGGVVDNKNHTSFIVEEDLKEFIDNIKEDLQFITNEREEIPTPTLDELLDKIGDKGIETLSTIEKNILNNYSKQKN